MTDNALTTLDQMQVAAKFCAPVFKMQAEAVMVLFLIAQAEGMHPMRALQDYDVIEGKPAMKSAAMLSRFLARGGKLTWHSYTAELADATFTTKDGIEVRQSLSIADARERGLPLSWYKNERTHQWESKDKANWKNHPAAMLRARVVSAAIRMIDPGAINNMHDPDELDARDVTAEDVRTEPDLAASRELAPAGAEPPSAPTGTVSLKAEPPPLTLRDQLAQLGRELYFQREGGKEALAAILVDLKVPKLSETKEPDVGRGIDLLKAAAGKLRVLAPNTATATKGTAK